MRVERPGVRLLADGRSVLIGRKAIRLTEQEPAPVVNSDKLPAKKLGSKVISHDDMYIDGKSPGIA